MRRWLVVLLILFSVSASAFAFFRTRGPNEGTTIESAPWHLQQHDAHGSSHEATKLMPTIRGDRNPGQIPEHVAYAHFLRSVTRDSLVDRGAIALEKLELAPPDRLAFENALRSFKSQMASVRALEERGGRPSELQQAQRQVLDAARGRINSEVSAEGRVKLDEYIRHYVTPNIVIYEGRQ